MSRLSERDKGNRGYVARVDVGNFAVTRRRVDGALFDRTRLGQASAEVDYLFFRNYGAAVFYDAGNAGNEPWPDVKRSVGIGMRWRTPVGMLRIDIAHPLDDPDEDYRLHLSIGSDL